MNKIYTLLSICTLAISGNLTARSADFITAPMHISPPDGTVLSGMGNIDISWPGESFVVESDDTSVKNQIDLSNVTVTLNSEVNTEWKNYTGAELYIHHIETTTEGGVSAQDDDSAGSDNDDPGFNGGNGSGEVQDAGYVLTLYLGVQAYWWRGEIGITIANGVVETTGGQVNPEINLTYYVLAPTSYDQIRFTPESGQTFDYGIGEIIVTWDVEGELRFNPDRSLPIYCECYDMDDTSVKKFNLNDYSVIEDNALVISLEACPAGEYFLIIPEGTVFIGEDYMNLESIDYAFTIAGGENNGNDDDSNGVQSILQDNIKSNIFDLNGVKMDSQKLSRGIYIIQGKKIFIK